MLLDVLTSAAGAEAGLPDSARSVPVLEDQLRAHPLVSQCMVVGEGRPYIACLVTLDPETLEFWKRRHRASRRCRPQRPRQ